MGVNKLYGKPGYDAFFDDTRGLLRVDLARCPSDEEFDHLWTVLSTFVSQYDGSCVIHLRHVDDNEFDPPTQKNMMHMASMLFSEFKKIDGNCRKIIVQPKIVDDKVQLASTLFQTLFSALPLRITDREEEVERLLCKYCAAAGP